MTYARVELSCSPSCLLVSQSISVSFHTSALYSHPALLVAPQQWNSNETQTAMNFKHWWHWKRSYFRCLILSCSGTIIAVELFWTSFVVAYALKRLYVLFMKSVIELRSESQNETCTVCMRTVVRCAKMLGSKEASPVVCYCVSFQFEHWNELQPEIISQTMNAVWNSLCAHLSLKCFISAVVKYITAPQIGAFLSKCLYCFTDVCISTWHVCACVYIYIYIYIYILEVGID